MGIKEDESVRHNYGSCVDVKSEIINMEIFEAVRSSEEEVELLTASYLCYDSQWKNYI